MEGENDDASFTPTWTPELSRYIFIPTSDQTSLLEGSPKHASFISQYSLVWNRWVYLPTGPYATLLQGTEELVEGFSPSQSLSDGRSVKSGNAPVPPYSFSSPSSLPLCAVNNSLSPPERVNALVATDNLPYSTSNTGVKKSSSPHLSENAKESFQASRSLPSDPLTFDTHNTSVDNTTPPVKLPVLTPVTRPHHSPFPERSEIIGESSPQSDDLEQFLNPENSDSWSDYSPKSSPSRRPAIRNNAAHVGVAATSNNPFLFKASGQSTGDYSQVDEVEQFLNPGKHFPLPKPKRSFRPGSPEKPKKHFKETYTERRRARENMAPNGTPIRGHYKAPRTPHTGFAWTPKHSQPPPKPVMNGDDQSIPSSTKAKSAVTPNHGPHRPSTPWPPHRTVTSTPSGAEGPSPEPTHRSSTPLPPHKANAFQSPSMTPAKSTRTDLPSSTPLPPHKTNSNRMFSMTATKTAAVDLLFPAWPPPHKVKAFMSSNMAVELAEAMSSSLTLLVPHKANATTSFSMAAEAAKTMPSPALLAPQKFSATGASNTRAKSSEPTPDSSSPVKDLEDLKLNSTPATNLVSTPPTPAHDGLIAHEPSYLQLPPVGSKWPAPPKRGLQKDSNTPASTGRRTADEPIRKSFDPFAHHDPQDNLLRLPGLSGRASSASGAATSAISPAITGLASSVSSQTVPQTALAPASQAHKPAAPRALPKANVKPTSAPHPTPMTNGTSMPLRSANTGRAASLIDTTDSGSNTVQSHVGPGHLFRGRGRHDNDFADISKISIIPTSNEISSLHKDYRPLADPSTWHVKGIVGLIDRNFRLYREEQVESLRETVRNTVKDLQNERTNRGYSGTRSSHSNESVYRNLQVVGLDSDKEKGLSMRVSFSQPRGAEGRSTTMREAFWKASGRLLDEALVALVSSSGNVVFATVHWRFGSRKKTKLPTGVKPRPEEMYSDAKRAQVTLHFVQPDLASVKELLVHFNDPDKGLHQLPESRVLIELKGKNLNFFYPTLQVLQKMVTRLDMPFKDILAPKAMVKGQTQQVMHLAPPRYMLQQRSELSLSPICRDGQDFKVKNSTPSTKTLKALEKFSSLDKSQAVAVVNTLSRSLSLIQGPPGTGKSYTGVSLLKVMAHNKDNAGLGPVIVVCYTNHALDQILEHLVDQGMTHLVRMGSQCKSEKLEHCLFLEWKKHMRVHREEHLQRRTLDKTLRATRGLIQNILGGLLQPDSPFSMQLHLERTCTLQHKQLFPDFGKSKDPGRKYQDWLAGGKSQSNQLDRDVSVLQSADLDTMTNSERSRLHRYWVDEIAKASLGRLMDAIANFHKIEGEIKDLSCNVQARLLQTAKIIGLTNSGLARNWELLQKVKPKILLCEEAGEVLEAHVLTSFLPSIQHAILIGDHKQLRPTLNNRELSSEDWGGEQIAFDKSLFERLVEPSFGLPAVPLETLSVQRRMHPSISNLVKSLYPTLQDENVDYPEVPGMKHRLFWLDHQNAESEYGANPAHATSSSNAWEATMTVAMTHHLIKQGTYEVGDIAIITPYLAQVDVITRRMAAIQGIVTSKGRLTNLAEAVRISTVDNFQGEEAKIIIISLVRSNELHKCGFLRTMNRINVLLSRAKHGMYIIGDTRCVEEITMWRLVLDTLNDNNLVGSAIPIVCPQHPDVSPAQIEQPKDFAACAPLGGCTLPCNKGPLPCGHACISTCHSEVLHQASVCGQYCAPEILSEPEVEFDVDSYLKKVFASRLHVDSSYETEDDGAIGANGWPDTASDTDTDGTAGAQPLIDLEPEADNDALDTPKARAGYYADDHADAGAHARPNGEPASGSGSTARYAATGTAVAELKSEAEP